MNKVIEIKGKKYVVDIKVHDRIDLLEQIIKEQKEVISDLLDEIDDLTSEIKQSNQQKNETEDAWGDCSDLDDFDDFDDLDLGTNTLEDFLSIRIMSTDEIAERFYNVDTDDIYKIIEEKMFSFDEWDLSFDLKEKYKNLGFGEGRKQIREGLKTTDIYWTLKGRVFLNSILVENNILPVWYKK